MEEATKLLHVSLSSTAGTGLDFSAASAVVFVELPQEVALVRQAEDRAHRHGQKRSVNVYFLVAKGTSDERRSAPNTQSWWYMLAQAVSVTAPLCSILCCCYARLCHAHDRNPVLPWTPAN